MRGFRVLVVTLAVCSSACSGRRLPPGTPPPEYEAPVIPPWSPDASDAGPAANSLVLDGGAAPANSPGPDLSPDAGVR